VTDTELLEQRLDLFQRDGWRSLVDEYTELAESLEKIYNIEDISTLYEHRGQVFILNMIINLEESTKLALEQLE
jgi:hypothetical protein